MTNYLPVIVRLERRDEQTNSWLKFLQERKNDLIKYREIQNMKYVPVKNTIALAASSSLTNHMSYQIVPK